VEKLNTFGFGDRAALDAIDDCCFGLLKILARLGDIARSVIGEGLLGAARNTLLSARPHPPRRLGAGHVAHQQGKRG
jgi:hypothetical protein